MVQVPAVASKEITEAYRLLHRADLKVSIANAFKLEDAVYSAPVIARAEPAAHRRIRRGGTVVLYVRCGCNVSSQALPHGKLPSYTVPEFVGRGALASISWSRGRFIATELHLGPVHHADGSSLLADYVIVRQRPRAGARITYATIGRDHGVLVTPVELWTRPGGGASTAGAIPTSAHDAG